MPHTDYTKEVGLPSAKKTMPRIAAYLILALVIAAAIFGISRGVAEARHHSAEERAAASPAPAPASSAVPAAPDEPAPASAEK